MKLKITRSLLAVFLLLTTFGASATLIGDTVGTTYISSLGYESGTVSSVVGAGEEGGFFGTQFFDYDVFSFDIRTTSDFCGMYSCSSSDMLTLSLTGLDFTTGPITNVSFTTNLLGVSFVFGSDFVNFTWSEQSLATGVYLSAIFETASVPEPSIVFLLATGLIGMVGMSRRRRLS